MEERLRGFSQIVGEKGSQMAQIRQDLQINFPSS